MKILITGSSGFIGGHLTAHLLNAGHEVLGLDKRLLEHPPDRAAFAQCDLLNGDLLSETVRSFRPDAICHLAARCSLNNKEGLAHYAANTVGVEHLLDAIRQTSSVRRTVFVSTKYVCREGYMPATDTDFCPDTLYGMSKVLAEQTVRARDGANREWCIVRPTTVWGPGMSNHYVRFLRAIEKRLFFNIGSHNPRKCLSYVGNAVVQLRSCLEAAGSEVHEKVLYLADYEPMRLHDWVDTLQGELGAPQIPTLPESLARLLARMGDLICACGFRSFPYTSFRMRNILSDHAINVDRIRAICPALPFNLNQAVSCTVAWYRSRS